MEMFILVVVLWLIAFQGAQYFFGLNINASIKNILKGTPEVDVNVETDKETRKKIVKKPPVPEIKNIDQISNEEILSNAHKIVHFGWKKEAIPFTKTKKSLIARFFSTIFE